jgi:alcohol dehydrogenase class IV
VKFEYTAPHRIIFGPGTLQQVGKIAAALGNRALVVTGIADERVQPLLELLNGEDLGYVIYTVEKEPSVEMAQEAAKLAQNEGCSFVIGIGGGSAMDTAKAAAAFLTNPGDPYDHLEVVGHGKPLRSTPAPWIAIPTTAGTGSEVTRNAVLLSIPHKVKVSLRSMHMLAHVAIVDPELTVSAPPAVTASTGLDALTQLLEPFVSIKATPMTDAYCREALPRAAWALPRVYADGSDLKAREQMAYASLSGGLALANGGLGAVHGIAGPFGGTYHAPHGAVCAALLAPIAEVNLRALQERAPESPALARYAEAAALCTGNPKATAADLVAWLRALVASLEIPGLAVYNFGEGDFDTLIAHAVASSSMKGNPIVLTEDELRQALRAAL